MPTADVVLFSKGAIRHRREIAEHEPPLSRAIEVSPGIQLAAIRQSVAHVVFHACKFRDLEHGDEEGMYGFVRYDPPGDRWDSDQTISKALYLSHFIHAHQGGFEFAARIVTDDRRKVVTLKQADVAPSYARAYPCVGVQRRWLTQADGDELAAVVRGYDASREFLANTRLGMAVSLFADTPFLDQGRPRVSALAGILEGLVSTRPERALKQFVVRVPALANEVGLAEFDRPWADRLYKLRSRLAHGNPLFQSPDETHRRTVNDEVNKAMLDMDELLRRIIKRALLSREFAQRVDDVDIHWPVSGKGCARCRAQVADLVEVFCPRCGVPWRS